MPMCTCGCRQRKRWKLWGQSTRN